MTFACDCDGRREKFRVCPPPSSKLQANNSINGVAVVVVDRSVGRSLRYVLEEEADSIAPSLARPPARPTARSTNSRTDELLNSRTNRTRKWPSEPALPPLRLRGILLIHVGSSGGRDPPSLNLMRFSDKMNIKILTLK